MDKPASMRQFLLLVRQAEMLRDVASIDGHSSGMTRCIAISFVECSDQRGGKLKIDAFKTLIGNTQILG